MSTTAKLPTTSHALTTHLQPPANSTRTTDLATWRALAYFNLHRVFIATLFTALMFSPLLEGLFQASNAPLAGSVALIYLALATISVLLRSVTWLPFLVQVCYALSVDIVMILVLMHALGGVGTGIGILLVITIGGGALLLPGRLAILFAAVASMGVLGEHAYSLVQYGETLGSYTQAGLLGAAYFGTAILGCALARRARESEVLAEKRGVDLANLAQLNDLIIQRMRTGTLVIDGADRIRQMNESAWYLMGMPDPHHRDLARVSPELLERLRHWRDTGQHLTHPLRLAAGVPAVAPRFAALGEDEAQNVALVFLEDTSVVSQRAVEMNLTSLGRLAGSIAHEIRNPLGAISHAGQLLCEVDLSPSDKRLAEIIRDQARRMNEIVENVLQISRRERCRPERLLLSEWLGGFTREFRSTLNIPAAALVSETHSPDLSVLSDPSHLHQVLWNLCQNAVRYGHLPEQEPRIVLRAGPIQASGGVVLDVTDRGPGIEPEHVTQLFEPFYTSDTRGSGLGLYIAKQLCEANQASLEFIPIPTGGSCFRITFPRPRQTLAGGM